MDLVNSVTQNSNNRNVTMENQGGGSGNGGGGGDDEWNRRNNDNSSRQQQQQQQHQMSAADDKTTMAAANPRNSAPPSSSSPQMPDYLKAIGMDPRKFWPKKYRFTREKSPGQHNPLTIAQRNFYETNGYIVFDDCASKKLLDSIRSQHNESGNASLQQASTNNNNNNNNNNDSACKDLIDQNRQPRQLLFRDWVYLPFRPIDKVCCAITAIEPLEHVLLVVPGTHRVGQVTISSTLDNVSAAYDSSQEKAGQSSRREIFECSPEKLSTLVDKSKKGFKYVNLKPGQTLFYHPGLIHGFSNDLVNFRKNQLVSIAYYAAADCEYIDLRKSSPDLMWDSQKEQVPIGLAHFEGKDPRDYTSWLDKPKLLSDERANL